MEDDKSNFPQTISQGQSKKGPECIFFAFKCWKGQLQASANRSLYLAQADLGIKYSNLIRRSRFHPLTLEAVHYIILRIITFGFH